MLRTLFCEGNAVLCEYASTGDGQCERRAHNYASPAPSNSTAPRHPLLTVGSARLKFVAEFLNETEKGGFNEISSFDRYFSGIHRHRDGNVTSGRLL